MNERNNNTERANFLPADIDDILEKYGHFLKSYSEFREGDRTIYGNYKRTPKRLEVLFPLVEHPIHGITGIHAVENYNDNGYIRRYQYQRNIIIPKMGIQTSHISGWGNDPHDAEWTPGMYKIATEPHHHHFDPNDRKKRQENYEVRSLEQVFQFVIKYLKSGHEYKP